MSNLGNKAVFAKNLRYYINLNNITQREVSEIVGVSPPTVNEWLKGKKYPRIDKIERLARHFRILKSDLIEEHTDDELKQRTEIQKKNNVLADIILRMRKDSNFFNLVNALYKMDADKLASLLTLLK